MMKLVGWASSPQARRLHREHRSLEVLFETLLEAARANDAPTLSLLMGEFERRMNTHMRGEEEYLLQPLHRSHPAEVEALLADHEEIRAIISTLGIEVDTHSVRLHELESLGKLLRAHAEREDYGLYSWAEQELEPNPVGRFLEYLRANSFYV